MLTASSRLLAWLARQPTWLRVVLVLLAGLPILLPAWIIRRTDDSRAGRLAAAAVMASSLLLYVTAPEQQQPPAAAAPPIASPTGATPDASPDGSTTSPTPRPSATAAASPTATPSPSPSGTRATTSSASPRTDDAPVLVTGQVVDAIDGDTIDLADGTRIRLAIVDTPEVYGGVEPCGREASAFTAAFVADQFVAIYRPEGGPRSDRHGRMVGEVVRLTDGASLNVALVEAGLARIDQRFTAEDPDLAERLELALARADDPDCE